MATEPTLNSYFYPNNAAPQNGKLSKAPDYSNVIAKPAYREDIDFMAEASTPDANRSFINSIITESGGLPEMSPKPNGNSNGTKKSAKKGY